MSSCYGESLTCSKCREVKTQWKNDSGQPVCTACETKPEPQRICPDDQSAMQKVPLQNGRLIVDRCPTCNGVWLDHKELEALAEEADTNPVFATGLLLGIAMG
ncbi:MAG: zf-TFIIB domain-containing protein [bacterium]|nr:zf-TFIIB domain-containing protein [bacterium]